MRTSAQEIHAIKPTDTTSCNFSCFLTPSKLHNKGRDNLVVGTSVGLGGGILGGLSYLWYSGYERTPFHLFNDGLEWRGMDKVGHAVTAFHVAEYIGNWYEWAGVSRKKAAWRGALTSFAFQGAIEVLDGFSEEWGFSVADIMSNSTGIGLFVLQEHLWENQPITLKFGFIPSEFRKYRSSLLGENELTGILKDYNGQSYWLSMNIAAITGASKVPSWLNLAVGYGAGGMLGGRSNPAVDNNGVALPNFERYSQFYLSPDLDFTKIKTKNIYLKTLFKALSFYKFPFPAIEVNTLGKIRLNWVQ